MEQAGIGKCETWAKRIEDARESGKPLSAVASEYGVSTDTVRYWARRMRVAGIPKTVGAEIAFAKVERSAAAIPNAPVEIVVEVGPAQICVRTLEQVVLVGALLRTLADRGR